MIYGERVRLRADERADISLFTQWLNDPEVRQHLSMYLPVSLVGEEQWFENMLKQPREEQPLGIEVRDGDNWKLIGNCGFMNIDWQSRHAEIGLFIGDKSCWDRGNGSEVTRLMLKHGFETLNLNRIYLRVHEQNKRGIYVYEKVGFVHEGRHRQEIYQSGQYQDVLYMSVLRSEWDASQA